MHKKYTIPLLILLFLFLIQLIRPAKNLSKELTTTQISNQLQASLKVASTLKAACYDCHSSNTNYYWYSEVMPLGWLIDHHIQDGKKHFNFDSLFAYSTKKRAHKLEELVEEVEKHEMPLLMYKMIHKEARLDEVQTMEIIKWADSLSEK